MAKKDKEKAPEVAAPAEVPAEEQVVAAEVANAARIEAAEQPKSGEERARHAIGIAIAALEANDVGAALRVLRSA